MMKITKIIKLNKIIYLLKSLNLILCLLRETKTNEMIKNSQKPTEINVRANHDMKDINSNEKLI